MTSRRKSGSLPKKSLSAPCDRRRDGEIDMAAVDCVTWALIGLYRPAWQAGLRVLAETAPVTAPPFVTSRRVSRAEVALLRDAITQTLADPRLTGVREHLLLSDVSVLDVEAYAAIGELERSADALGYRERLRRVTVAPGWRARPALRRASGGTGPPTVRTGAGAGIGPTVGKLYKRGRDFFRASRKPFFSLRISFMAQLLH